MSHWATTLANPPSTGKRREQKHFGDTAEKQAHAFVEKLEELRAFTAGNEIDPALADRFYVNKRATMISNGHSTEFMFFPSDLDPRRSDYLNRKIHGVLEYATAFKDVEELEALETIPKQAPKSHYLALGLYLYLADECSRLCKPLPFLEALREAGATVKPCETPNRDELLESAMAALRLEGMEQSHGRVLKEWANTGGYTIHGVRHELDAKDTLHGAYAFLARDISFEQDLLGMNLPISYALGNARKMRELKTEDKAYKFTEYLSKPVYKKPITPYIRKCINAGYEKRAEIVLDAIHKDMGEFWEANKNTLRASEPADKAFARQVFSLISPAAREVLYHEGYCCAYANHSTIDPCYPDTPIKGVTAQEHEKYRVSNGLRQKRYRVIFLSNAGMDPAVDAAGQQRLIERQAQILIHEILHMAIAHMNDREKESLWHAVEAVSNEIERRGESLPAYFSHQPDDLLGTLDYRAKYYKDKYPEEERKEEVACNVAGLMVKYPHPANPGMINGKLHEGDPFAELPSLGALATQIEDVLTLAAMRCRKKFATVNLSKSVRAEEERDVYIPPPRQGGNGKH